MLDLLTNSFNLLLVVVGFGLIVFIHELGHFVAAKWAGIRVLAFAIGFGSPLVTWRKGVGLRRGSSEGEYLEKQKAGNAEGLSPTEYRLNWMPLGGYVKMLGQEDLRPDATSAESDSYQSCPPIKRMVVISAGVVMNLLLAGLLFVVVFLSGLDVSPPVVGATVPGRPAAQAQAINADPLNADPYLRAGDRIVSINGAVPTRFDDLLNATGLAGPNDTIELAVERDGLSDALRFSITPEPGPVSGLLEVGVEPPRSTSVIRDNGASEEDLARFDALMASAGLAGVKPGAELILAGGDEPVFANDLRRVFNESDGSPVELVFKGEAGTTRAAVQPVPEFELGFAPLPGGTVSTVRHVLGLTPVMTVADADEAAQVKGLRQGDVFLRLGAAEYPSYADGLAQIRASTGSTIKATVLRDGEVIDLELEVNRKGQIGFGAGSTADTSPLLAMPPPRLMRSAARAEKGEDAQPTPASRVIRQPGLRLEAVIAPGGARTPVATLTEATIALRRAVENVPEGEGATVLLEFELPLIQTDAPVVRTSEWNLTPEDIARLNALGWESPFTLSVFEPYERPLIADGPIEATVMGLRETRSWMIRTYLTLGRLFQGTVRIEHLRGPVGIAHLGTVVADRGMVWLLFFMALISVNLAVINFLPLPIVDGGQFLMLIYEAVRGKPVPVIVQEGITLAGLALIGTVFVVVTFQDLSRLIGG